jgi:Poly A polymerase head domain/Probable RNA and SrmB- binding site of polymerase A
MIILFMLLSPQKLKDKILADGCNSVMFGKRRGRDLFLVGGYIRDALRGISSADRDYVMTGDVRAFISRIKTIFHGTLIEFKKGKMIRLSLKSGITLDISRLQGSLKEDLSKRDFTVNAIAWSPDRGLIDPYNGLKDLRRGIIRALSEKNLKSDPLRLIRAYRFAAEMNVSIDNRTRELIKKLHAMVETTSAERITSELFNILNFDKPAKYLRMALSDKLLQTVIPISEKVLRQNIKAISNLEEKLKKFPLEVKSQLKNLFSQNLTFIGLLRLEVLLWQNSPFSSLSLPKLQLSNKVIKRITLAHRGMMSFEDRNLFDFFYETKESSVDVLIIEGRSDLLEDYERFVSIWKKGVIDSHEISRISKIEGPVIGQLIKRTKKAEFQREINSKKEAVNLVKDILHTISSKNF